MPCGVTAQLPFTLLASSIGIRVQMVSGTRATYLQEPLPLALPQPPQNPFVLGCSVQAVGFITSFTTVLSVAAQCSGIAVGAEEIQDPQPCLAAHSVLVDM